jgi:hypothetical protein
MRDIPPALRVGDDIRRLELLGVLVSSDASFVEAYVGEPDLDRVAPGARASFILVDGETLPLVVSEVAHVSTRALEVPELASTNAGPIPVRHGPSNTVVPDRAIYRVILTGDGSLPAAASRRAGRVAIEAPTRSIAAVIYRRTVALILRESAI